MADNVAVTEGSGKIVSTDEIQVDGSHTQGQVQFMKLVDGTLNGTGSIRVNQAAKANALTVAPASDISDATYIGDIKFGEALPAGTNGIGKLTANSGVDIGDVDITSIVPLTGATNLGKARDSALGATDTGVMALAVRDDTLTTLTPADGDYVPLRVGSTGKLHVTDANITTCNTGAVVISSGTVTTVSTVTTCSTVTAVTSLDKAVYVDDADWVDNTSSHTLVGGVYQSSPHTVTDGDVSPFGVDVNGNIVLGTSAKAIGKLAANTGVDIGDVDVTSIVPGIGATNLGKAEDAGHSTGDVGVMALSVRQDTAAALGGTDADYQPLITDANGRLHVISDNSATHASAAPATGATVMGAGYSTGLPTDVGADGDAARILTDRYGRVLRGLMPQWFNAIYNSADASGEGETVKAATASRKIYILSLTISVDAEMWVELQDEDSNAITPKYWFKAGGGTTKNYPPEAPLVLNVVNKDLEVITEGAGNIGVEITGYLAV
jgi:hypothetical protein